MVSGIFCLAAQALQSVVAFKLDSSLVDSIFSVAIPTLYVLYNVNISIGVYVRANAKTLVGLDSCGARLSWGSTLAGLCGAQLFWGSTLLGLDSRRLCNPVSAWRPYSH
jgi:hypothetical protein